MNAFGEIIHDNKMRADQTALGRRMSTALSLAGIVLGWAALIVAPPQRTGPLLAALPLANGFGGMLVGWSIDRAHADMIPFSPICRSLAGSGFTQVLSLHFRAMPGMHIGMLVGGLIAVPDITVKRWSDRRGLFGACAQYVLCSACMLVGMTLGALWITRSWQMGAHAWPEMFGAMCLGMTWGMVASVGLCRALTGWCRATNRNE
jgi:hypothetical protein